MSPDLDQTLPNGVTKQITNSTKNLHFNLSLCFSQACTFAKKTDKTSLHVTYQGETHIGLCKTCCKTWYFTFDNLTCTDPASIDAVFSGLHLVDASETNTLPKFMHGSISGYCSSVPGGLVRVGISLDDCPGYPSIREIVPVEIQPNSRLIIQEVPAPQV